MYFCYSLRPTAPQKVYLILKGGLFGVPYSAHCYGLITCTDDSMREHKYLVNVTDKTYWLGRG